MKVWHKSTTMRVSIVVMLIGIAISVGQHIVDAQILGPEWTGYIITAMGILTAILRSISTTGIVSSSSRLPPDEGK